MDRPLELVDFSGGITDDFIDAAPNMAEILENVDLEKVGSYMKPKTRPGSSPVLNAGTTADYMTGTAGDKYVINAAIIKRRGLFKLSRVHQNLLCSTDLINTELNSSGVPFLFTQYAQEAYNSGIFRKPNAACFAISDELTSNALPAKEIKITTTEGHNEAIVGAQEHTDAVNDARPIATKKLYVDSSSYLQITNTGLPNPDTFLGNGADIAVISGAAQMGGGVATVPAGGVTLYCYLYSRTYTLENGATVLDRSAPSTPVSYTNTPAVGNAVTMTVASLINDDVDTATVKTIGRAKFFGRQYDVSNVKIEVYKTKINGSVFYLTGTYNNNPAGNYQAISDSTLETTLDLNQLLYTEDGSQPNDAPPNAMHVHAVDNTCFYGNIAEASKTSSTALGKITYTFTKVYYPNRVYHSIPGDLDSVPRTFFVELAEENKGLSSYRSIPLVFCKNQVFRLEGSVDVFGKGSYVLVEISKHAGCKEHNYIVQTPKGVFWAGNDGFYWTDGYKCEQISSQFKNTYKSFWPKTAFLLPDAYTHFYGNACYNEATEKVYWPSKYVSSPFTHTDQLAMVLHSISDKPSFTTWRMGGIDIQRGYFVSLYTSFISIAGVLLRVTKPYCVWHDAGYTNDLIRFNNVTEQRFALNIKPRIKTLATNFGDNFTRKFCTRTVFTFRTKTNTTLAVNSINDGGASSKPVKDLRLRVSASNPSALYATEQMVQAQRRFPAKHLRCAFKQIELVGSTSILTNSDILGLAEVVNFGALRSIILTAPSAWPLYCEGSTITLTKGTFTGTYTITQRTSNVQVEVSDPLATFPATAAGFSFSLNGYPTNESFTLLGISLHWEPLGRTQDSFNKSEVGTPA